MDILLSFFLCLLLLVEYGETTSRVLRRHLLEGHGFRSWITFLCDFKTFFWVFFISSRMKFIPSSSTFDEIVGIG